ncbi:hypothetical protein E2C01_072351 [Portunus trituberculatus]|uniref:Uncharacterized protein n=1 Tax=Portunus trituberculatus TaxID=210409 RepID=A0A5B7I2E2_PORTR|nr:hypothetical protein [Portunus trituberculatus]
MSCCLRLVSNFSSPFIALYTAIRSPLSLFCSKVVRPSIHSLSSYDCSLKLGESFVAALFILSSFLMCFFWFGDHIVAAYSNFGHIRVINSFFIISLSMYFL